MDIVRPLLTSEDYVVQKYTKAHPFKAMGRVQASGRRSFTSVFNFNRNAVAPPLVLARSEKTFVGERIMSLGDKYPVTCGCAQLLSLSG